MAGSSEWTKKEIKELEEAYAAGSQLFLGGKWNEIAKLVTTKTADQIKTYYWRGGFAHKCLHDDIRKIVSGELKPTPSLKSPNFQTVLDEYFAKFADSEEEEEEEGEKEEEGGEEEEAAAEEEKEEDS